jgi:hypothetical protein
MVRNVVHSGGPVSGENQIQEDVPATFLSNHSGIGWQKAMVFTFPAEPGAIGSGLRKTPFPGSCSHQPLAQSGKIRVWTHLDGEARYSVRCIGQQEIYPDFGAKKCCSI